VILLDLKYPWRKLRPLTCHILVRKYVWAIEANGRRHLVGASAFFTEPSAERAQVGALRKLETKWTYIHRNHAFIAAKTALDRLQPGRWGGTIH
jgi:hypothetical protein